jgi:hypothetical protein
VGLIVEFQSDGTVLNTYADDSGATGEWFPNDTQIGVESDTGGLGGTGEVRVLSPIWQAADFPQRAARQWNPETRFWDQTGGQPEKTNVEKAIEFLNDNPVPDQPTVDEVVMFLRALRFLVLAIAKFLAKRFRPLG